MGAGNTLKKEKMNTTGLIVLLAMIVAVIAIGFTLLKDVPLPDLAQEARPMDPTQEARPIFSYRQGNGTIVYDGVVYIRQTYKDK